MRVKWTDLNLSALKYFVDSVVLKSLTKAADLNHVTRPAISQSILRLETQIGYSLLEHKKKHFALTKQGYTFFLKAQQAIDYLNQSLNEKIIDQGNIHIACSATLAEHLVLPLMKKIKSTEIANIKLRIGTSAKVRQLIHEGASSLGLLIDDEQTYGFDSSVLRIGEFEFQSASGRLDHPIITTEFRPEVILGLKSMNENVSPIQIESWSLCRKIAEALKGTCLVPDLIPRNHFKRVNIKKFRYKYKVLAITKNKNLLSPLERNLFENGGEDLP